MLIIGTAAAVFFAVIPDHSTKSSLLPLLLLLVLAGCAGEDAETDGQDGNDNHGGGGDLSVNDAPECLGSPTYQLASAAIVPSGDDPAVPGLNLDDAVTEDGAPTGCGRQDFVSPDGVQGVDNQLAVIADGVETFFDLRALLTDFLAGGEFSVGTKVEGAEGGDNDDCITVELGLMYGEGGAPLAVENGRPIGGQTIDFLPLVTANGAIANGVVTVGPLVVPASIGQVDPPLNFDVEDATLTFEYDPVGTGNGMLAGVLDTEVIIEAARRLMPDLESVATTVLNANADMNPDPNGKCEAVSAALTYEAVPVTLGSELTERPPTADD